MTTIAQARQAIADAAARAELYRMWHTAQRMGATHAKSLDMMGPRTGSPTVEALRTMLLTGTRQRQTIALIVSANDALTQPFEAAILSVGEESGSLDQSLASLEAHFKAEHRMLLKIWSKLTYPLVTSLVFVFIAPLPLVFRGQSGTYLLIVAVGLLLWYGLGGGVIVALAAHYANRREFVLARLARAIATGAEAGLPLDRVATLAAQSTGHSEIITQVQKLPVTQLAAQPLSTTFGRCAIVPVEMTAAMKTAEVSGDFSGALRKLADLYDPS